MKKLLLLLLTINGNILVAMGSDQGTLHYAARQGDSNNIKDLLEKNADMNIIDEAGMTPLHWAAFKANPELVKTFIYQNANLNQQDCEGRTPLHWAIKKALRCSIKRQRIKIVALLCFHGADTTIADNNNVSSQDIINNKLKQPCIQNDNSRLENNELTAQERYSLMEEIIIYKPKFSTQKERCQVIKCMLEDPSLAYALFASGLATKNARKR